MDILGHLARAFDFAKDPNPDNWKTINGAHVHMDGNGQIDGGAGGKFNGQSAHGKTPQNPQAQTSYPQNEPAERQRQVNELAAAMAESEDLEAETKMKSVSLGDNPSIDDLKQWWVNKVKASKVGMKKAATPEMHDKWAKQLKEDLQTFKDGMAKAGVSMAEIGKHNFDEMLASADVSFWEKMDGALGPVPKAALKNWEKLQQSKEWQDYLANKGQGPAMPEEPPADPLTGLANATEPEAELIPADIFGNQVTFDVLQKKIPSIANADPNKIMSLLFNHQKLSQQIQEYTNGNKDMDALSTYAADLYWSWKGLDDAEKQAAQDIIDALDGNALDLAMVAYSLKDKNPSEKTLEMITKLQNVGMTKKIAALPDVVEPTAPEPELTEPPADPLGNVAQAFEPPAAEPILNWKEFNNFAKIGKALKQKHTEFAEFSEDDIKQCKALMKNYQKLAMALNAYMYNNQSSNYSQLKAAAKDFWKTSSDYIYNEANGVGGAIIDTLGGEYEKMLDVAEVVQKGASQPELEKLFNEKEITSSMGMTKLPDGVQSKYALTNPDGTIAEPSVPSAPQTPVAPPEPPAPAEPETNTAQAIASANMAKKIKQGMEEYLAQKGVTTSGSMYEELYTSALTTALETIAIYKNNPSGEAIETLKSALKHMKTMQDAMANKMGNKQVQHAIENYFDTITGKGTMKALKELQASTENGAVDVNTQLQTKMGSIQPINEAVVDPVSTLGGLGINGQLPPALQAKKIKYPPPPKPPATKTKGNVTALTFNHVTDAVKKQNPLPKGTADLQTHKKYIGVCSDAWNKMSYDEKIALYDYTGSYHDVNETLRGEVYGKGWTGPHYGAGNSPTMNGAIKKKVQDMTDAIDKSSYSEPVTLIRGIPTGLLDTLLDLPSGTMEKIQHQGIDAFRAALEGADVTDHGFMSCGIASGKGFSGDIKMEIYCPAGTKMMYMEPFSKYGACQGVSWNGKDKQHSISSEAEMLLQRGTKMRIDGVVMKNGKPTLMCQVVAQEGYKV